MKYANRFLALSAALLLSGVMLTGCGDAKDNSSDGTSSAVSEGDSQSQDDNTIVGDVASDAEDLISDADDTISDVVDDMTGNDDNGGGSNVNSNSDSSGDINSSDSDSDRDSSM